MENASELSAGIIAGTVILIAMAGLIIILIVTYQNKRKEILRKSQEDMLYAALAAEKNERERIARDLHDGVSGYLNAGLNFIEIAKRTEDEKNNASLEHIKKAIKESLLAVREVSHNLAPAVLLEKGFAQAAKDNLNRIFKNTSIAFSFTNKGGMEELTETESYEFFRVLQELTTNIIKYAEATEVNVKIEIINNKRTIELCDDGIAFDFIKATKKAGNHHGLKNILGRLQRINAAFSFVRENQKNKLLIWLKNE